MPKIAARNPGLMTALESCSLFCYRVPRRIRFLFSHECLPIETHKQNVRAVIVYAVPSRTRYCVIQMGWRTFCYIDPRYKF